MQYLKRYILLLFLIAGLVAGMSFKIGIGHGQSQGSRSQSNQPAKSTTESAVKHPSESPVRPTTLTPNQESEPAPGSSSFAAAASRNAILRTDLTWVFGGKQQHGWYLYTSLINRLLKTEAPPDSNDFAAAVARWQQTNGLKPTGVLDEESFKAMTSRWQALRLKNREYAQPDQLLTAPVSDFWDPSRMENLRQVERETYAAYKRMIAAAVADPSLHLAQGADGSLAANEKFLKILSAFRPREYQEQLRRQSPNAGSAGLAVNSPHFTGRALDLYVGGDPVETKDPNRAIQVQTPVYKWLVQNAERFGFRPYFYEPWHWEYVGN